MSGLGMNSSTKVLALWDHAADRPRGKTHTLDCRWALGISKFVSSGKAPQGYEEVDASVIPPATGRCSHCGGGR